MLSALRPPEHASVPHAPPPPYSASAPNSRVPTDPTELPPDRLHVEMEMSPDSQIILYGPLLKALVSIKVHWTCLLAWNFLSLNKEVTSSKDVDLCSPDLFALHLTILQS